MQFLGRCMIIRKNQKCIRLAALYYLILYVEVNLYLKSLASD